MLLHVGAARIRQPNLHLAPHKGTSEKEWEMNGVAKQVSSHPGSGRNAIWTTGGPARTGMELSNAPDYFTYNGASGTHPQMLGTAEPTLE